jgi:hypothetical protein
MDPLLRRIADYLSSRKTRSSIDPLEIGVQLLPHFYILEIERKNVEAPPQFRIRLAGTALDRTFNRCLTGHYLEEFLHGPRSVDVLDEFHNCADTHKPVWMRQVVRIAGKLPRYVEGVVFHVEPHLICGGLMFGEIAGSSSEEAFERRNLQGMSDG